MIGFLIIAAIAVLIGNNLSRANACIAAADRLEAAGTAFMLDTGSADHARAFLDAGEAYVAARRQVR